MNICVVGTGYVGLVSGAVLAHMGNQVWCVDKDSAKVQSLKMGKSPIYEPGIEELIRAGLQSSRLIFTQDLKEAAGRSDVLLVAVGTPPGEDGTPDISAVEAVAKEVAPQLSRGYRVFVNKSTVPVGTGRLVSKLLLEHGAKAECFDVASNPEFLREGTAVSDTMHPDRVVIGTGSSRATALLRRLFEPLGAPILETDIESSELIKYASNCFLALKISYINAVSQVAELCGANVDEVAKGMGYDARIAPHFLKAGLGWGGSCFPKDVKGFIKVANGLGYDFKLMKEVEDINDKQSTSFVARIQCELGDLSGKTLALLGLSFKPDTDDVRDSKAITVANLLLAKGVKVRAYDPIASVNASKVLNGVKFCDSPDEAVQGADGIVLVTDWPEFASLNYESLGGHMNHRFFFDGRRFMNPQMLNAVGFKVITIGTRDPYDVNAGM